MTRDNKFDRVAKPDAARQRDRAGKEALYSVGRDAPPAASVVVTCDRCHVERSLQLKDAIGLFARPIVVNPFRPTRVWSKCPTCDRRAWLHVAAGQMLRGLVGRDRADGDR